MSDSDPGPPRESTDESDPVLVGTSEGGAPSTLKNVCSRVNVPALHMFATEACYK